MSETKRITLTELLKDKKTKVTKRQQASMVSPAYRSKPKNEQIMSGVTGVDEITLANKETVFICVDDELVFATANGANSHRATMHSKKKTENTQVPVMKKVAPVKKAAPNSVATRQKNIAKAVNATIEITPKAYDDLKKALEEAQAKIVSLEQTKENDNRAIDFLKLTVQQLQGDRELLDRACETLRRDLKEALQPTTTEKRFIPLIEAALENLRSKYAVIQVAQAEADAKVEEVLNS